MIKPIFKREYVNVIKSFIKSRINEADASGVVIGLSGGLDSAVTTKLCAGTLGKKKVLCLLLPTKDTPKDDTGDALEFAKKIGVKYKIINISDVVKKFASAIHGKGKKEMGNIHARTRMIVLYYFANKNNYLVVGSGNKTELLMGYFTKHGDGACDIMPLADLYKTQIRELAKHLKIPEKIINKTPRAGLWKGQTDEKELGIKYDVLDQILYGMKKGLKNNEIAKSLCVEISEVKRIKNVVSSTKHKRKMPRIARIGQL
ncbi:MAG: NAD+ synthase [Candidatus Thermoplasmatota archaeon]|nr:NAD+ synthase [Candidatus Thermoplasmatota archaeon]